MSYNHAEINELQKEFFSALDIIKLPVIPTETRFWMLRTQRGHFYQEFTRDKYVALAWNIVDKATSFTKDNVERIKAEFQEKYGTIRPQTSINKCDLFINEVKEGDYLIIPSAGTREITIALAGEYYEEENCTYEIERETIAKIKSNIDTVEDIACPYKKRRKITPLISIPSNKLHHKLYRAISNYHGISSMDDYAHQILSAVYPTYTFGDRTVVTLWSAQTDPISPRALSGLLYYSTDYFCNFTEEENLSTKVNLNSEGPIQLIVEQLQADYPIFVKVFLVLVAIGVIASNAEKIPDLCKGIFSIPADLFDRYLSAGHRVKELKAQDKTAELEHELKELEIMEKKLALSEKIRASGLTPEALENDLIKIVQHSIDMKINPAIELYVSDETSGISADMPCIDSGTAEAPANMQ